MAPRTAAQTTARFNHADATAVLGAALRFVPPGRGKATFRKWLETALAHEETAYRRTCMATDAVLLASDLVVSQPSASGATALDRMARQHVPAAAGERAALAALRTARFRLLRLDRQAETGHASAVDVVSGETLDLVPAELPKLLPRAAPSRRRWRRPKSGRAARPPRAVAGRGRVPG